MDYVELDVTTNFSFLRGASHPGEMVRRAAELGCAAVGVSDVNSVAGMVRAHQAAKEAGIRLCAGARLRLADGPDVLVWVENRAGWANLCRLLTEGKRRAEKGACLLRLGDVLGSCAGLWGALAAQGVDPHLANPDLPALQATAGPLKEAMGARLSLAVARLYAPSDAAVMERAQRVCATHGVPLLAVNQVHYHQENRRMLQDVLTCVRHGCTISQAGLRLFANGERFLKSPREMEQLFRDLPGAIERGVEIAGR